MQNFIRRIAKNTRSLTFFSKLFGFAIRKCTRYSAQLVLQCNESYGSFVDSEGKDHALSTGLRDALKPDWRSMFVAERAIKPLSVSEAAGRLSKYRLRVETLVNYLSIYGEGLGDHRILEVGACDGETTYALAEYGPEEVVASDIAKYYLHQEAGSSVTEETIARKNDDLSLIRSSFDAVYRKPAKDTKITFIEDDMTCTALALANFDYVFSWEVLEHFSEPRKAFEGMAQVLKPGGYAFHEYNPFFSLIGGHSLCTLDFLWGHTRVSKDDFKRYVHEIRPDEEEVAKSFFNENLNRMCLADLSDYARDAGFEIIDIVPFVSEVDSGLITGEIIEDARRHYPSVTFQDFVCPKVWVLMRKG